MSAIMVDLNNGLLRIGNCVKQITPREAEILHVLNRRAPNHVTLETLVASIYGARDVDGENLIRVYINRLRKILQGMGYGIESRYRFGYALRPAGSA